MHTFSTPIVSATSPSPPFLRSDSTFSFEDFRLLSRVTDVTSFFRFPVALKVLPPFPYSLRCFSSQFPLLQGALTYCGYPCLDRNLFVSSSLVQCTPTPPPTFGVSFSPSSPRPQLNGFLVPLRVSENKCNSVAQHPFFFATSPPFFFPFSPVMNSPPFSLVCCGSVGASVCVFLSLSAAGPSVCCIQYLDPPPFPSFP